VGCVGEGRQVGEVSCVAVLGRGKKGRCSCRLPFKLLLQEQGKEERRATELGVWKLSRVTGECSLQVVTGQDSVSRGGRCCCCVAAEKTGIQEGAAGGADLG
jgi:hypothetical protein